MLLQNKDQCIEATESKHRAVHIIQKEMINPTTYFATLEFLLDWKFSLEMSEIEFVKYCLGYFDISSVLIIHYNLTNQIQHLTNQILVENYYSKFQRECFSIYPGIHKPQSHK